MWTLAIETSGLSGSIALLRDQSCVEERRLQLGLQHGQSLIPAMGTLFNVHGIRAREVGLIAVSIGPGSYTGLRVGVVCAKTLSYVSHSRAVGVSTLLAIAHNAPADVQTQHVVADAQRGDLFVGRFERSEAGFEVAGTISIVPANEWIDAVSPEMVVSGPGVEPYVERLDQRCRVLDVSHRHPRASIVAQLGLRDLAGGTDADPWQLEPLYLRRSSAETQWELRGYSN